MATDIPKFGRREETELSEAQLDQLADLLKERIYASLALLAVLISLRGADVSKWGAAVAVGGTVLSLWAASLVATQMAQRMVHRRADKDGSGLRKQLLRHSPLLASGILPLLIIGLAGLHVLSLRAAIDVSIGTLLLSLAGWSLESARAMGASGVATVVLGLIEVAIGLAVVGLKIATEH